jgi:hypothetical protein
MKIIDVPSTGKLGLTVTFPSRYGLIRRAKVIPSNPNSPRQYSVRSAFTAAAHAYDALTTAQQNAWIAAAAAYQTKPSLGQSGPMTGLQLYVRINATLELFGLETVTVPPAVPAFPVNPITALTITNVAGVVTVKLAAPTPVGENTVLTCIDHRVS